MDTLFIAYGRPVTGLNEIYLSYQDALALIHRRFFCIQGQHTLGYDELPDIRSSVYELQKDKLEEYLYHVKDGISEVKLFLTDLYLRIKERINLIYSNNNIPFSSNSQVIDFIDKKHYLYEIIQFLSEHQALR